MKTVYLGVYLGVDMPSLERLCLLMSPHLEQEMFRRGQAPGSFIQRASSGGLVVAVLRRTPWLLLASLHLGQYRLPRRRDGTRVSARSARPSARPHGSRLPACFSDGTAVWTQNFAQGGSRVDPTVCRNLFIWKSLRTYRKVHTITTVQRLPTCPLSRGYLL